MNLQNLHAPFPPNEIEWRVGSTKADKSSGLALAYLTARHVMERLDEVCGAENWQDRYEFHGKRTICYLSIRVGEEWVTKADGAGDSDVEAEKGAISDALKRAAVKWGVGRYLYSLGNTWVDVEPAGKSVRIKKAEFARLAKMMEAKFGLPPSDMGNVNEAAAEVADVAAPPAPDNDEAAAQLASNIDFALEQAGSNLANVWREHWPSIQTLPKPFEEALTAKKDRLKAQLSKAA